MQLIINPNNLRINMRIKVIQIVIVLVLVLLLFSCGSPPIADFTWEPEEPKAGLEMEFMNLSTDARSYSWNFGDASIGNETNPKHTYENPGNYIVDLLAHKGLQSHEKTVTITVVP